MRSHAQDIPQSEALGVPKRILGDAILPRRASNDSLASSSRGSSVASSLSTAGSTSRLARLLSQSPHFNSRDSRFATMASNREPRSSKASKIMRQTTSIEITDELLDVKNEAKVRIRFYHFNFW